MSNRLLGRFGTSSWAYEGWRDQIYHRPYSASRFSKDSGDVDGASGPTSIAAALHAW